ncbi:hypothetical protein PINS_up018092 [Pythium insidiosum]|nr:hypothetical protein PINS_up018092 [Pythium insidiosum]
MPSDASKTSNSRQPDAGAGRLVTKKVLERRRTGRSTTLSKELAKTQGLERNTKVVQVMLLHLTGVDGIVTSQTDAAAEAIENLHSKTSVTQDVEQLFRGWQTKEQSSRSSATRLSLGRKNSSSSRTDEATTTDLAEDYMGEDYVYDSDESITEKEIVGEMTRQWAEHRLHSTSPFIVPLRPLQPKRGDEVLGSARRVTIQQLGRLGSDGARSRLRSIGSFRAALQRSATMARHHHQAFAQHALGPDGFKASDSVFVRWQCTELRWH